MFQIYVLIHISIYVSKSDTLDIRKRILYIYYIMKEKNNFIRGYVEIITLQMLIIEDSYGMKLVNDIRTISDGLIDLSVGTLYPTLYKLVEEGYVTDYKKLVGKRKTTIYYHLTDIGQQRLKDLKEEYHILEEVMSKILKGDEK